jgi:hypothetical protein
MTGEPAREVPRLEDRAGNKTVIEVVPPTSTYAGLVIEVL